MTRLILLALLTSLAWAVAAEVITRPVEYTHADTLLRSVLVYDSATPATRPGLVMVPNWMGMTDANVQKAKDIAARGYVVLLADIYGVDTRPANAREASEAAGAMRADRMLLRERAGAALDELIRLDAAADLPLDGQRIGAIGFCFGGTTVLEMARAGMALAGVVSFHGGLATDHPAQDTPDAAVLVLNGADDAAVSREEITAFEAEMRHVDADWQLVQFGGAVHCFAEADAAAPPNCLYHEPSARRAFGMMDLFFAEQFGAIRD